MSIPNLILNQCKAKWGEKIPLPEYIDRRVPKEAAWQGSEHDLQVRFFRWLAECQFGSMSGEIGLWLTHAVPNGGLRDKITASRLIAEGVKGSIPDVFVPMKRGPYGGMYIEFKKAGTGPGIDQRATLMMLAEQGYCCHVINDEETAKRVFNDYFTLTG